MNVRSLTRLLKALSDETRLGIVALLAHGELCVCHLEAALNLSQPNISRHMAILRSAGVVEPRRFGNWIYYRLAPQGDAEGAKLLSALARSSVDDKALQRRVRRVTQCCGPRR